MDDDYTIFKLWVCLSKRVREEEMCIINLSELHAPLGTFTHSHSVGVKRGEKQPREKEEQLYNLCNWDHLLWCGRWKSLKKISNVDFMHHCTYFSTTFPLAFPLLRAVLWKQFMIYWTVKIAVRGNTLGARFGIVWAEVVRKRMRFMQMDFLPKMLEQ